MGAQTQGFQAILSHNVCHLLLNEDGAGYRLNAPASSLFPNLSKAGEQRFTACSLLTGHMSYIQSSPKMLLCKMKIIIKLM